MKLGVFAGVVDDRGDDPEASGTWMQDPLERYRLSVERHLGDKLVLLNEETFEPFFAHVIADFDRGVSPAECARTWVVTFSTGSAAQ